MTSTDGQRSSIGEGQLSGPFWRDDDGGGREEKKERGRIYEENWETFS
jgi:hypothetical protein